MDSPLSFREGRPMLPSNRAFVLNRANKLDISLRKSTTKREHMFKFMQKVIKEDHAEVASSDSGQEM